MIKINHSKDVVNYIKTLKSHSIRNNTLVASHVSVHSTKAVQKLVVISYYINFSSVSYNGVDSKFTWLNTKFQLCVSYALYIWNSSWVSDKHHSWLQNVSLNYSSKFNNLSVVWVFNLLPFNRLSLKMSRM